ncbi:MAG: TetR/AcrR family transcriptional regulator [Motilibacteraceae bacterium]
MEGRDERRERTRQRILAAAWELSGERGLTGWALRDLGTRVGMRAPSLYVYFTSKNDLYDAMFAQGYRQLIMAYQELRGADLPAAAKVRAGAHTFFAFAVSDPARMQLLFLRVIPSFVPSAASYALAEEVYAELAAVLAEAGLTEPASVDLWTATLTGLATQQVSNDPGGTRWAVLVDRAVDTRLAGAQQPDDGAPR